MDLISVGLLRRGGGARHKEGGDELKWEKNRWRKNSLSKTFFQEYFNLQLPKQVCLIFHPNETGEKHKTIIKNIETLRKKYIKKQFVSGFFAYLPLPVRPDDDLQPVRLFLVDEELHLAAFGIRL